MIETGQRHEPAADWFAILGPRAVHRLRDTALLVFTPDAIVSRQVGAGAGLLADAGFRAVSAAPVRITPAVCRRLWRTERCGLPPDRLAVCELLLSYTDSIAVLLLDEAAPDARHTTAADRLLAVKGAGELSQRRPGTLRAKLYSPNSMFRLVHTSDTPLDVVRELRILFGDGSRRSLLHGLRQCAQLRPAALETMAAAAFDDGDPGGRPGGRRRLDASDALRRTIGLARSALREAPGNEKLCDVVRLLTGLHSGDEVSWRVLSSALRACPVPFDPWDVVVIGAQVVCDG